MPRIVASSAYSFHQLLPSWLWSPAGCNLESVLGPRGSSGVLFSWSSSSFFLFLCLQSSFSSVAYLPSPVVPVLPPVASFPSLLPSFPPPVISLPSPAFLLAPPVSSLAPPVAFCPPMIRLFLRSLFCLFLLLLWCLLSFPFSFPVICSCLSSVASRLRSTVASCPFFSCHLFLLYLSDHCLLGNASCRHLCFPFCRLLHYSCPIPGASPDPPSLFFSSPSSLVPPVSYLSCMTSISRTSLAPFFPKELCSSPFISAGASPCSSDVLRRLVPRLFPLVLALFPLLPLVLFMMTLFSILLLMMALIRRVLCSHP